MAMLYFLAFLAFNLLRQSSFIYGGDSAEFSLAAKTFSIPHPPGYPAYSLFINIANAILPYGTPSWKASLLSSIPAVLTGVVLYLLVRKLTQNRTIGLLTAGIYMLLFPVWLYSLVPEVFMLNNFIVICITYILLTLEKKLAGRQMSILSFLLGLAVSHHHIFILFLPGWIYLARNRVDWNKVSRKTLAFFFAAGLSFYLYAPAASFLKAPLDWENASSLEGFVRLVTRSSYGTFQAYRNAAPELTNQLFDIFSFFYFILKDFRLLGIILLTLGFWELKKQRRIFVFTAISIAVHLFFLFYSNFILHDAFGAAVYERFMIPIYLLLAIPLAYGFVSMQSALSKISRKYMSNPGLIKQMPVFTYAVGCIFIAILFLSNYKTLTHVRDLNDFDVFSQDIVNTLPKNSILYLSSDLPFYSTLYKYYAEKTRPDIKFVYANFLSRDYYRKKMKNNYPDMIIADNYKSEQDYKKFLYQNYRKFPIFFEKKVTIGFWARYGLLYRFYPDEKALQKDMPHIIEANKRLWNKTYRIPRLNDYRGNLLYLNELQSYYIDSYTSYSKLLYSQNDKTAAKSILEGIIRNYDGRNLAANLILINMYMQDKDCTAASKYFANIDAKQLFQRDDFLRSAAAYLDFCGGNDQLLDEIKVTLKGATDFKDQNIGEF